MAGAPDERPRRPDVPPSDGRREVERDDASPPRTTEEDLFPSLEEHRREEEL